MRAGGEARRYAALPAAYLTLFFLLPLVVVLLYALGLGHGGLSGLGELARHPAAALLPLVAAFHELVTTPYYRARILFTLAQAAGSALLVLLLGLPLAYLFSHYEFPGRRLLRALFTAPFVLPAVVVALALHAFLGASSPTGVNLLGVVGPVGAILLAHTFYNTSLVLRLVSNAWERLPPHHAEAARTLGATRLGVVMRVELRLVAPAILAASLLVFAFCLTSFGIILLLGGPRIGTIETLLFEELQGFRPRYAVAAALALLQLLLTYAALLAFVVVQRRLRVPVAPRPRPDRLRLTAGAAAFLVVAGVFLLGPPLTLVVSTFQDGGTWSLHAYGLLLSGLAPLGTYTPLAAAANSLRFASSALLVALPLAWLAALAGQRARGAVWAESLLLLPLGLSPVVVGLGLVLAWDGQWLPDLRASSLRIVLAQALVALPFATRILAPTLEGIPETLREAARTLGSPARGVARLVDLPLAAPALGVAAVYAFGSSLGEFGATLVLRRADTTTLPLAIYDSFGRLGAPYQAQAAALATFLLVVAAGSFLLLDRLRARPGGDFA